MKPKTYCVGVGIKTRRSTPRESSKALWGLDASGKMQVAVVAGEIKREDLQRKNWWYRMITSTKMNLNNLRI